MAFCTCREHFMVSSKNFRKSLFESAIFYLISVVSAVLPVFTLLACCAFVCPLWRPWSRDITANTTQLYQWPQRHDMWWPLLGLGLCTALVGRQSPSFSQMSTLWCLAKILKSDFLHFFGPFGQFTLGSTLGQIDLKPARMERKWSNWPFYTHWMPVVSRFHAPVTSAKTPNLTQNGANLPPAAAPKGAKRPFFGPKWLFRGAHNVHIGQRKVPKPSPVLERRRRIASIWPKQSSCWFGFTHDLAPTNPGKWPYLGRKGPFSGVNENYFSEKNRRQAIAWVLRPLIFCVEKHFWSPTAVFGF